jgi:hypothetical protein
LEDRLPVYKPREKNIIQEILQDHFSAFEENNGTIIYTAKYNEYWKQNIKLFKAGDFIAELTQLITDPHEVQKILECLKRNKAPPFEMSHDLYPDFHFRTH